MVVDPFAFESRLDLGDERRIHAIRCPVVKSVKTHYIRPDGRERPERHFAGSEPASGEAKIIYPNQD